MLPSWFSTFHETGSGWDCDRCRWQGRLGLTLAGYQALEAGELHIDYDLYKRIVDLCGWPRG